MPSEPTNSNQNKAKTDTNSNSNTVRIGTWNIRRGLVKRELEIKHLLLKRTGKTYPGPNAEIRHYPRM